MDLLTKLATKKDLDLLINNELINLGDYSSIIYFDIDTLITVVDIYGIIKGDSYLQDFALKLKHYFKEPDLCFRYAGDEFIVLLKNNDNIEAITKELLDNSVDKSCIIDVTYSNNKFFSISACIVKNLNAKNYDEFRLKLDDAIMAIHNTKEHLVNRKYKKQGILAII